MMSYRSACTDENRLCGPSIPFYIQTLPPGGIAGDCQFESVKIIANSDPKYEPVDTVELRRACATEVATSVNETQLLIARDDFPRVHQGENWITFMPKGLTMDQYRLYLAKSLLPSGDHWGEAMTLELLSKITGIRFIVINGDCKLMFATESPFPQSPVGILRLHGLHYEPLFTMAAAENTKKFLFKYNSECIRSVLGGR
jgi:hypothetical protein